MKTSSHSLRAKCIRLSFILTTALLLAASARATGSTTVVISQVYGGGGNAGSIYKNDFIELFNLTGAPISLSSWSVQYTSAAGTTWQTTALSGSIPANGYYLIQEAVGSGGTTSLPTPDATGSIMMGATGFKVALCNSTTALSGSNPVGGLTVVDFIGCGTANAFEGAVGPTPSNTTSDSRANGGCQDTDNNANDFTAGAVNPRNSASATHSCSAGTPTQVRVETAAGGAGVVVTSQSVAAGSSVTVYAVARDVNGLFVSNAVPNWSLVSITGGVVSGDLVGSGNSATFTGHIVGTAAIDAAISGLTSTDSGTIAVTAGTPTQLHIETQANGNGTVIGSQTVPTGTTLVARSIRRDLYGNFVDNVAADGWSLTGKTGAVADGDLVADAGLKFATFTGNNTGTAVIHTSSGSGALTADSGTLTVAVVAPTITAPPPSYTTNAGTSVTFFVSVSGSTPLTYQWKKNGVNISGKTDSTLVLSGIVNSDAASYSVGVTNTSGGTESAAGTLTVNVNAFTLLTYNVMGNFSANWDVNHPQVQALERQLTYLQPDIITFNEIPNGSNATLIAIIANSLPGYYSTGTDAATDGGIRSAIVSRWPIISSNSFFHNLDLTPWGAAGQTYTRDLYVAKIQVPGMSKPVNIATSHLKSNGTQPDSCIRRAGEANVVSNFFYNFRQTNTDLFVMTGDWNQDISNNDACSPTNKPVESITASNFTGLYLTTPVDPNSPGATTNFFTHSILTNQAFDHRYDYIAPCGTLFTNINSSKVFRTSTLPSVTGTGLNTNDDSTASDHLPVLMSFNNPDTASPTFAVQPASTSANASSTVTLSAVVGGAQPLTYKWYKGATPLSNGAGPGTATIAGASTASLTLTGVYANDAGSYSLNVTNALGSTNSAAAVLTVVDPAILTNPSHQTNGIGATVSFSATAGGTAPVTYQWQHAGTNLSNGGTITGATSTALSISGIITNDGGSYTFIANNTFGAVTSSFARLVVTVPASITTDPTGQNISAGGTILLSAVAAGSPNPNTHWERNGVTITNCSACSAAGTGISGATGGNLKITNAIAGDAGSYTFVASNSTAVVTSAVAIVVVNDPFITTQPADAGGAIGGSAVFKVVASGTAPITYRWQKNGINLSDGGNIAGSTTTNLSVSSVSTADIAAYRVVVTGTGGTITSSSAQLILTAATGEFYLNTNLYSQNFDSIGTGNTITLPPGWLMSSAGNGLPSYTGAGNVATVTQAGAGTSTAGGRYNWNDGTTTTDHSIGFLTSGSYANPNSVMLGIYNNTGSNITALALTFNYKQYRLNTSAATLTFYVSGDGTAWTEYPAGDGSFAGGAAGQVNPANVSSKSVNLTGMNLPVGGKIYLRWDFNTGASSSQGIGVDDFTLNASVATPSAVPPTITAQPAGATVWQGANVTLAVGANGDAPLAYQWYKNNVLQSGKTDSTLTLTSVTPAASGSYTCVVTNDANTVTSDAAVVVVQAPVVKTIAELRALVDNTTWTNSDITTIYQTTGTVTTFTNTVTGNNTAFTIQDNSGSGIWVFLSGITTTINAGDSVQVTAPLTTFQGRLEISVSATNPSTGYTVLSSGNALPAAQSIPFLTLTNFTANDAYEGKRVVIGPVFMDLRTNTFATNSLLTVTNVDDLTQTFQVFIDRHCADFQGQTKPVQCYVYGSMDQSTTTVPPTNNYRVSATRFADIGAVGPTITTAPTSQTVNYGQTATFSGLATGGSITYQWQRNGLNLSDTGNISGSTTTSLTVSSATTSDDADYAVVASITGGSTTSSSAHLTVNPPTPVSISSGVIATPSVLVADGTNVTLSVGTTGSDPKTYQWYVKDFADAGAGTLVASGASNQVVVAAEAIRRDKTTATNVYYVIVDNAANAPQTSTNAKVTIVVDNKSPAPLVLTSPAKNGKYGSGTPTLPFKPYAITGTATDPAKGHIAHVRYYYINSNTPPFVPSAIYEAPLVDKNAGTTGDSIVLFNITTNPPLAGTNLIAIWPVDLAGNPGKGVTNAFFYQVQIPFTLHKVGDGTGAVSFVDKMGDKVNTSNIVYFGVGTVDKTVNMNEGETYTLSYTPDRTTNNVKNLPSVISVVTNAPGWGGPTNSIKKYTGPAITVEPTTNSVSFEFDRDRFVDMAGNYNAVLTADTNNPTLGTSRYLHLTVAKSRVATGYLMDAAHVHDAFAVHSSVDSAGHLHLQTALNSIVIDGDLAWTGSENPTGIKQFTGSVTFVNTSNAVVVADMEDKNALPTPGFATMSIPGVNNNPGGSGIATHKLLNGSVTSIYTLGDDDKHPATWPLKGSRSGNIPQWIITKTGVLFGNMNATDGLSNVIAPSLSWIRNPTPVLGYTYANLLPGGFVNSPFAAVASHYDNSVHPGLTGAFTLSLSGGGLANDTNTTLIFSGNTFTTNAPSPVTGGKVDPVSGKLTVIFLDGLPSKHKTTALGVVLQNATNGAGFFIRGATTIPTNSGSLTLTPQ